MQPVNTLSGLTLTSEGLSTFTQSLGLIKLGYSALAGITDFGTITSSMSFGQTDTPYDPTIPAPPAPFPEPSTYAMMGMGLVGLMFAARRAKAAN